MWFVWSPIRPRDHQCAGWAREEAITAADRRLDSPGLPRAVASALQSLRVSRAVLLKRYNDQVWEEWGRQWSQSKQGRHFAPAIIPSPPSDAIQKEFRGLSRQECSAIVQLRSGHVGLTAFLARIRAVDSPLCPACHLPETPAHYLLTCKRYNLPRHDLRRAIDGLRSLRSVLGDPEVRSAVLTFIRAKGRLDSLLLPPV